MNWIELFFTSSCLLISFTYAFQPLQAQISKSVNLKPTERMGFVLAQNDGNPPPSTNGGNDSGGSRGNCPLVAQTSNNLSLQPLVSAGLSATDAPTFWVYVPYSTTSSLHARLSVREEEDKETFTNKSMPVTLSGIPGIIKLPLPKTLEQGKIYRWSLTIVCNLDDESANPVVSGLVKQIIPNSSLMNQLKTASSPREQALIYRKAGYWYDALTILAEQRLRDRNNSQAVKDWSDLLQSANLEAIGKQPIVSCCTLP